MDTGFVELSSCSNRGCGFSVFLTCAGAVEEGMVGASEVEGVEGGVEGEGVKGEGLEEEGAEVGGSGNRGGETVEVGCGDGLRGECRGGADCDGDSAGGDGGGNSDC